ncbi:MAG: tetratricopeptide repeat protein [Thermoplasmata archaeon]|nr:tetratricopeptide repeat protein [Thermoplasmata archaeon]
MECPNCGAQWDSLVTVCSMCGYNLKTHTIRVSTPSEARPQKAEGREAPRAVTTPAEVSKPVKPTPVATPEPAEPTPKPKPQARKSKKKKGKEDREPMQKIGKEEKSLPPSQATPPPISKERDTEAFLQAAVPLEGGVEESGIGERERGDSIGENGAEERRMGEKNGLEERRMGENVGKPADGRVKREEFLENLTFKFLSTETEAAAAPMVTPMRSRQTVDWFSRGVSLELKGDSRGALEAYDNALNASPNDPWIWLNEGVALQRLGRLEEALKCYDESIKLDPTDPDVWSNRATALRGLGRLEEAVESYKRALEKNPDDGGIWSNLGIALRTMGRFDEALTAYESALELIPKDVTVWLNKAAVLSSLRRFDDAMECYDHILYLDPGNAGVKELKRFLMRRMKLSA